MTNRRCIYRAQKHSELSLNLSLKDKIESIQIIIIWIYIIWFVFHLNGYVTIVGEELQQIRTIRATGCYWAVEVPLRATPTYTVSRDFRL